MSSFRRREQRSSASGSDGTTSMTTSSSTLPSLRRPWGETSLGCRRDRAPVALIALAEGGPGVLVEAFDGRRDPRPAASAQLLGQRGDDSARPAEIAEQVAVLVARHFANEFRAVWAEAGEGVLDVVDGEHDAVEAQRVRRGDLRLRTDRL